MGTAVSSDPLLEELQAKLSGIVLNNPGSYNAHARDILRNGAIFGSNLTQIPLANKIEEMLIKLLADPGSARRTLVILSKEAFYCYMLLIPPAVLVVFLTLKRKEKMVRTACHARGE